MATRRFSVVLATMLLLAASIAISAAPVSASHTGKVFGAKLTTSVQPSNSMPGATCDNADQMCTWVMVDAFNRPGNRFHWSRAPRDGVIKRIRLIAGGPGSFRLQLARVKRGAGGDDRESRARIVRSGKLINYQGQPDPDEPYLIESFSLRLPVKKGEHLAVRAKQLRMVRCTSGGPEILQFQPPLPVNGPLKKADDTSGCFMLLQAILR